MSGKRRGNLSTKNNASETSEIYDVRIGKTIPNREGLPEFGGRDAKGVVFLVCVNGASSCGGGLTQQSNIALNERT